MVTVGHKRNMAGVLYRHILPVLALGGFLIWPIQPSATFRRIGHRVQLGVDEEVRSCRNRAMPHRWRRTHQRVESRRDQRLHRAGESRCNPQGQHLDRNTRQHQGSLSLCEGRSRPRGPLGGRGDQFFAADHKLAGTPFGTSAREQGERSRRRQGIRWRFENRIQGPHHRGLCGPRPRQRLHDQPTGIPTRRRPLRSAPIRDVERLAPPARPCMHHRRIHAQPHPWTDLQTRRQDQR